MEAQYTWLSSLNLFTTITLCAASLSIVVIFNVQQNKRKRRLLNNVLDKKKIQLNRSVQQLRQSLDKSIDSDIKLTRLSISELHTRLMDQKITPKQLLKAFQSRALDLKVEGNSGIAEFVLEASNGMDQLSNLVHTSPLSGIPVSVKECWSIAGYDSPMGMLKHCGKPSRKDCVLIRALKEAGAIPFIMTASSQACRVMDGINPVHGNVVNPHNNNRLVGGSSCGDAVLLAQGGSPLSFGSDLGGSIRIPAAFCGLCCLKPTENRLSQGGVAHVTRESVLFLSSGPCPIARCVDDLTNAMRALLQETTFKFDPYMLPIPFREDLYQQGFHEPMNIGFYDTFSGGDFIHTVPAVKESVLSVVKELLRQGHHIVRFNPPDIQTALSIFLRSMFTDGGTELRKQLANEPLSRQLRGLPLTLRLPAIVKRGMDKLISIMGMKPMGILRFITGLSKSGSAAKLALELKEYRSLFHKAWDKAGPLDILPLPIQPLH